MRVIAGKARSLPLKTVEGLSTRPTTDRIKETLFNMLMPEIPGCRFLDLFSGSGAIGIEALSRGAISAHLVEKDKKACEVIKANLEFTKLKADAVLMECDAISAIRKLNGKEVFDVIFMDPPYNNDLEKQVLIELANSNIIHQHTLIIFEASLNTDISYIEDYGYSVVKVKKYKTNMHVFVTK